MKIQRNDILTNTKWDFSHPKLKSFVDKYTSWSKSDSSKELNREEYESDILYCLNESKIDGYELARSLEQHSYVSPDASLVELLNDLFFVKKSIIDSNIANWVKSENLVLPDNLIGKSASAKQNYRSYNNYFITKIYPDSYSVSLSVDFSKSPNGYGGYIVYFENVTLLNE